MRTTENRFYVYEHLRSDTGAVFYVGKGTGKRCTVRTGQKRSESERAKQSAAMIGKSQKVMTCLHCGKAGGNSMKRWHFDNCKEKT